MRTKDDLIDIEEVSIFYQYLYLGMTITFNNGLTNLTLTMDENFYTKCVNENFPDLPPSNFTDMLTLPYILGVIEILKESKATEFPDTFANRWEEIRTITLAQVGLNKANRR